MKKKNASSVKRADVGKLTIQEEKKITGKNNNKERNKDNTMRFPMMLKQSLQSS